MYISWVQLKKKTLVLAFFRSIKLFRSGYIEIKKINIYGMVIRTLQSFITKMEKSMLGNKYKDNKNKLKEWYRMCTTYTTKMSSNCNEHIVGDHCTPWDFSWYKCKETRNKEVSKTLM